MQNNLQDQLKWLRKNRAESLNSCFSKPLTDPCFQQSVRDVSPPNITKGPCFKLKEIMAKTKVLKLQRSDTLMAERNKLQSRKQSQFAPSARLPQQIAFQNAPKSIQSSVSGATGTSTSQCLNEEDIDKAFLELDVEALASSYFTSKHRHQQHHPQAQQQRSGSGAATEPIYKGGSEDSGAGLDSGGGHIIWTRERGTPVQGQVLGQLPGHVPGHVQVGHRQIQGHITSASSVMHSTLQQYSSHTHQSSPTSQHESVAPSSLYTSTTHTVAHGDDSAGSSGVSSYISELLRKRAELDAEIRAAELAAATSGTSFGLKSSSVGNQSVSTASNARFSLQEETVNPTHTSPPQPQQRQQQFLSSILNDPPTTHTFTTSWDDTPQAVYAATNAIVTNSSANLGYSLYYDEGPGQYADDDAPICECGIPCIRLTSRTSANMNREFYKCANSTNPADGGQQAGQQHCRFFEWVDKDTVDSGGNSFVGGSNVNKDFKAENKRIFGHHSFRAGQRECIEAALAGRDVFCLMPTGGGKSLIYQLPAWCCAGLAVVFSPLVSLIQDQVDAMSATGIRAVFITSTQDESEVANIYNCLYQMSSSQQSDDIKLLYITPEKFKNSPKMRSLLKNLYNKGLLSRFVIDEAHCLSEWGHDFRSDYLSLSGLRTEYPNTPLLALTATANQSVVQDCIRLIGMKDPYRHTLSFNRENIEYTVRPKDNKVISNIADIITARKDQTGIIYCFSKKDTEKVTADLQIALPAMRNKIAFYHADVPAAEKERRQRLWSKGDLKIICATIAFGMGINKPDVRYVIHFSMPKSLTNFYQESGRAGRDGFPSESIVFYSYSDKQRLCGLAQKGNLDDGGVNYKSKAAMERAIANIHSCADFCMNEIDCRRRQVLHYFGEDFHADKCNHTCDNCRRQLPSSGSVKMVWGNYTEAAKQIANIVKILLDNRQKLTLNKLRALVGSASKEKSLEGYRNVLARANVKCIVSADGDNKPLSKAVCEKVLHRMVLSDYLMEESQVTASSYTAEYIALGRKVHSLLSGAGELLVCVPQAVTQFTTAHTTTTTTIDPTSVSSAPRRPVASRKNGTSRKSAGGGLDSDESDDLEMEWISEDRPGQMLSSGNEENEVNGTRISTGSGKPISRHPKQSTAPTRPVSHSSSPSASGTGLGSLGGGRFKPPFKSSLSSNPVESDTHPRSTYSSIGSGKLSLKKSTYQSSASHMNAENSKGHVKKQLTGQTNDKSFSLGGTKESIEVFDSDYSDANDDFESSCSLKKREHGDIITIESDDDIDSVGIDKHRLPKKHRMKNEREFGRSVSKDIRNQGRDSIGSGGNILSNADRLKLKEWLGHYRRRWGYYWHYLNNTAMIEVTDKVPLTLEDLGLIGSFGQKKVQDHVSADKPPYDIKECPTWRSPASAEADAIRAAEGNADSVSVLPLNSIVPTIKSDRTAKAADGGTSTPGGGPYAVVNVKSSPYERKVSADNVYRSSPLKSTSTAHASKSVDMSRSPSNLEVNGGAFRDISQNSPDLLSQAAHRKQNHCQVYHMSKPSSTCQEESETQAAYLCHTKETTSAENSSKILSSSSLPRVGPSSLNPSSIYGSRQWPVQFN